MSSDQTAVEQPAAHDDASGNLLTGKRFQFRDHYEVGREKIREFARAVQNQHPAHQDEVDARKLGHDGIVASPTFASVIGMTATRALLETVLTEYDLSQVLHTDQVFEIFRPMRAGDRIRTEVEVESIRQFGDNDFVNVKFVLADQNGEVAQQGTTTIVARRGGDVDPNIIESVEKISMQPRPQGSDGVAAADVLEPLPGPGTVPAETEFVAVHTTPGFDEVARGDRLPSGVARLTRGDLVNYAGVSGDPNPIHFSDHAAELAGLPTVVAHGLLTMGLLADYLVSWLGDPTAVKKFSVRFSGFVPVAPSSAGEIEFSGRIKSVDPESRTATVLLAGTCEGRKLFGRAIAEVRLT